MDRSDSHSSLQSCPALLNSPPIEQAEDACSLIDDETDSSFPTTPDLPGSGLRSNIPPFRTRVSSSFSTPRVPKLSERRSASLHVLGTRSLLPDFPTLPSHMSDRAVSEFSDSFPSESQTNGLDSHGDAMSESLISDSIWQQINSMVIEEHIKVPIQGFEIMEERSKFTLFKLKVEKSSDESWHIFRRYTDFQRLNNKLKKLFPNIRLSLPPRKWFGDNFNNNFLEDRTIGLQAFINNIVCHRELFNCDPVRQFLCLDEPPRPRDTCSLEESRALCESLEEQVYTCREKIQEKNIEINVLEDLVQKQKVDIENLKQALRRERAMSRRQSSSPTSVSECSRWRSESSLPEQDQTKEEIESDNEHAVTHTAGAPSGLTSPYHSQASLHLVPEDLDEAITKVAPPESGAAADSTTPEVLPHLPGTYFVDF